MRRGVRALAVAAVGLALLAGVAAAEVGDIDPTFAGDGIAELEWGGPSDNARDLVIQPDGKVVVVGDGNAAPDDLVVARVNADGTLDTGFNAAGSPGRNVFALGGLEWGNAVTLQKDGKIIAVGSTGLDTRAVIARLNTDGTPDNGFGAAGVRTLEYGGNDDAEGVLMQPDGKIIVTGAGGTLQSIVTTRLTADTGLPDNSFSDDGSAVAEFGGIDAASELALQPDGKVVVAGQMNPAVGDVRLVVLRYNGNGTPDMSFDGDGQRMLDARTGEFAQDLQIQPDGRFLVLSQKSDNLLVTRLKSDGSDDSSFGTGGTASFNFGSDSEGSGEMALLAQGKILVAGFSDSHAAVARLQPGGTLDTTFRGTGKLVVPAGIRYADTLGIQPGGKIVIASDDGAGNAAVARLLGDPATNTGPGGPTGPGGGGGGGTKVPRCAGKKATIVGTQRSDKLKGTRRNDVIMALGGKDRIDAGRGNDLICAGDGNDSAKGGSGKDRIYGQNGKDKLSGGDGNDSLDGGASNDSLSGQGGKDRLSGGSGKDRLSGGTGRDSCNGGSGKDRARCERSKRL